MTIPEPTACDTSAQQICLTVPDVTGMSLCDAALAYAEAGWYVLPTDPAVDVKNPGSVVGGGWHEQSSRNPEQIRAWWEENPDYGIVLHAGKSGALVFDFDRDDLAELERDGRADIAEALRSAGAIQGTRQSGHRGHYLFRQPDNQPPYGNSAGAFMRYGEVRGKNGVIVAAPTPHPDAGTRGGEYSWSVAGQLSPPPEALRACLSEAAECADPLTDVELEEFLDTYTNENCGLNECINTVAGPLTQFLEDVEGGASRHDTLVKVAPWAFSEAMRGCYGAREAFGKLHRAFTDQFGPEDRYERTAYLGGEFMRVMGWAAAQADPDRAHRRYEIDEERLWSARPILRHIYNASLARQMDPRGVLAVELALAIASIPPYVTLPAVTATRASLNLHVSLVGSSSGGKSSSIGVAIDAIDVSPVPEKTTLGSGEGIAKAYAYRDSKTKEIVTLTDTLLFADTEVESVEALANRPGSPLMSQWRKTFTGEQLGFGYADPKHRIPVHEHTYRFCQILGIQPEIGQWLLTGAQRAGGTPQRMLWAPVEYREMPDPDNLPEWPGQIVLEPWPKLSSGSHDLGGDDENTLTLKSRRMSVGEPAAVGVLAANELAVPEEVKASVREARWRRHRGEVHELSGHAALVRLKVAAGFMRLDGRTDKITSEDWELAGIVMQISDRTRKQFEETLAGEAKRRNRAQGKAAAERDLARAEVVGDAKSKAVERVAEWIARKVGEEEGDGQTGAELRRKLKAEDRQHFEEAVQVAEEGGLVRMETITGPNGRAGIRIWAA